MRMIMVVVIRRHGDDYFTRQIHSTFIPNEGKTELVDIEMMTMT